jgi:hypothetical protein
MQCSDVQPLFTQREARCSGTVLSRLAQPRADGRAGADDLPEACRASCALCCGRRARNLHAELGVHTAPEPQGPRDRSTTSATTQSSRAASGTEHFSSAGCLVPATSLCEPNGDVKPATWHWFALVDIETYAFPTTPPNPLVATIDHEPMPVLLTRAAESSTLGYAVHPWKRAHWAANAHQSACGLSRGFFKEDREGLVEPANAPLTSV